MAKSILTQEKKLLKNASKSKYSTTYRNIDYTTENYYGKFSSNKADNNDKEDLIKILIEIERKKNNVVIIEEE